MCLKVQYYILCDKSCPEKERRYCIFDQFVKGFEAQNNHENIYMSLDLLSKFYHKKYPIREM